MASYKELLALGRDPVRVRAVARRLLASAEDWTEWERDFLEGLVAEYGSAALLVLLSRLPNRFLAPWIPVDRIVGMLQEIGAGGVDQPVRMRFR